MNTSEISFSSHRHLSIAVAGLLAVLTVILLSQNAVGQQASVRKLTLTQVEDLVSHHVPDSTMRTEIQRRGLAFTPNSAIIQSLRGKGAGPLTLETIEGLFPDLAQRATTSRSNYSAPELAIVIDPPSNVRGSPSATSLIFCSVTSAGSIHILGSEGNWYKTDVCGGKLGYIHRSQVKIISW